MKIYLRMKRIARIIIVGVTLVLLFFPVMRFITTYVIIPIRIPFEIEYDSGIIMIHVNAGIASEKSSNGMFLIGSIIRRPTITRAGAVAAAGIERKRGEKNKAMAKQIPTTNAVRPERPP